MLLLYLIRRAKDEPIDDLKDAIDQETRDLADDLFKKWKALSEEEFWETLAKYQEIDPDATLMDHVVFQQYYKQLGITSNRWIWKKPEDQLAIINNLIDIYNKSSEPKSVSVLYSNVTKQTYRGRNLTRDVASDVIQLALGQILKDLP